MDKCTSRFEQKPLRLLAEIGSFNTLSADPYWLARGKLQLEPKKALISFAGKKPVKRLELEDGNRVTGDDGHKLYVRRGDKILKLAIGEINIGDELVCLPR